MDSATLPIEEIQLLHHLEIQTAERRSLVPRHVGLVYVTVPRLLVPPLFLHQEPDARLHAGEEDGPLLALVFVAELQFHGVAR